MILLISSSILISMRRLLTTVTFAKTAPTKSSPAMESRTIVDPYFFESRDLISRVQNYFKNKTALN